MHPLALSSRFTAPVQLRRAPLSRPQRPDDRLCAPRAAAAAQPALPSHAAQQALQSPKKRAAGAPIPVPVAMPAPAHEASTLDLLRDHVFHVLDDLHRRSDDRPSWTVPLDRYFFAQKHQQVKRVRALFAAAFDYAARHADHPQLQALVDSDAFIDWIAAEHSLEKVVQLTSPPPAEVVPGALHRLQNAMAQLQILRASWPRQLS